jgi:hypothetical protein
LFLLHPREASFAIRGFHEAQPATRHHLERIGENFVDGYNAGLVWDDAGALFLRVRRAEADVRGFVAEGITMGVAVADALTLRPRRLAKWLAVSDGQFTYLTHVGTGWALARVPFWRTFILSGLDPVHRWLAFDGCGFHDTYFFFRRICAGWKRMRHGYESFAYHQGIGRALWFVGGGDIRWIAQQVNAFDYGYRSHLWSGIGLAIAYAGRADEEDLVDTVRLAGQFSADVAQGAAFAAAAHTLAKHIPSHTRQAVCVLTGQETEQVAALVSRIRAQLPAQDGELAPRYEMWRAGVRRALASETVPGA